MMQAVLAAPTQGTKLNNQIFDGWDMTDATAQDWPQRNWAIAILGAVFGLAVQQLAEGSKADDVLRAALATALITGGIVFAFTVDRDRVRHSAAFAVLSALLVGATVYLNSGLAELDTGDGWKLLCSVLTVVVAAPLFQGWCDAGRPSPPRLSSLAYPQVHDRAWMNILLWFACWLFAGIVFLLGQLLAELFLLIGIALVRNMMNESWFIAMLMGGAFGAASGLLRDRESLLITLQTVVRRVLSVLGPVLGAALITFLLALPFTGLGALWEATKSTTPILLSCVVGALILANATIGDSKSDEAQMRVLRWGATALGVAMLPLAIIAAISTGLRIDQYGLSPDRLWAIVFVGIALTFGAGYLWLIVRKRMGWFDAVRPLNLRLAAALCVLAFILATPLVNFGAWSTRSQLARLDKGQVTVEKFDWAALKFEFGKSGVAALERLAKSGDTPEIRKAAAKALKLDNRWEAKSVQQAVSRADQVARNVIIKPNTVPLPRELIVAVSQLGSCEIKGNCVLFYTQGQTEAVAVSKPCEGCGVEVYRFAKASSGDWTRRNDFASATGNWAAKMKVEADAIKAGKVEIRDVRRRQVYVDGKPAGQPFE